ncbi:adenosylcobinamide-GDP ribazoletransferase [Burkholderia glumae]|uniref:Adenosylcobinamide-GDP ribazoletransferase n=1 Tax=Burkholderia glumae TaxID=337 RepID=A0AAP9Y1D2_BURGL|nr:adenosylcobinamide-GDP ribazoletransferase [Burkholderia glumae]ACR29884.1 Cobalamin-5-phosphate synthase CobS [Burkholderia glumae BGR1]AJY64999.1 cobalamin 5'-phosphate synthase [Burkholderia glumae LMG 2196 = ATCC 33617]KHJ61945.1 cobalamin synthase [Burkholderia glumae]MCM2482496.1 adenosylcobinamide-GDP ribazoletransferase [Burkholderia glumae]MCM2490928.1 adenosylcobinamide-GDP ribazoletransferase [Burkholderia glumae]
MRWSAELRYFFVALGYFTRVPIPRRIGYAAGDLDQAARYFPLVGVGVGALAAAVYLGAARIWPAGVAVLLSMAATLVATGAFHEDGLADSCDGFGGGYARDEVLRIMRDSRIGTFGAAALAVSLALKWQALAALPPARAAWTLLAAHAASRVGAVSLLVTLDYVREEGKARPVARRMSARAFAFAALCGLPWLLCPGWPDWRLGLAALAALLAARAGIARYLRRRLGGYTGDCLGFAQQLCELAIYLTVLGWTSS